MAFFKLFEPADGLAVSALLLFLKSSSQLPTVSHKQSARAKGTLPTIVFLLLPGFYHHVLCLKDLSGSNFDPNATWGTTTQNRKI